MRIKLINLNTFYGGKLDWESIVSYLQKENPDIVLLQEVYWNDQNNVEKPFLNTIPNLQKELGYTYAEGQVEFVFETRDGITGPIGNGIMSRIPLENKKIVWLTGSEPGNAKQSDREVLPHLPRALVHSEV